MADPLTALRKAQTIEPAPPAGAEPFRRAFDVGMGAFKGLIGFGGDSQASRFGELVGAVPLIPGPSRAVKGIKGLYSRLTSGLEQRLPAIAHPNKILSLAKTVAPTEELETRGLGEFLRGKSNQMVPREDVLQHLEQNPIELRVKTLGEPSYNVFDPNNPNLRTHVAESREAAADYIRQHQGGFGSTSYDIPDPPKHALYQVPGGENYRETLITKPPVTPEEKISAAFVGTQHTDPSITFQSSHWDDPNVLVHVRSNERRLPNPPPLDPTGNVDPAWKAALSAQDKTDWARLGPKGRFLEEVQSDWHQQGRNEGYQAESGTITPEQRVLLSQGSPVPNAPFKSSTGPYTQVQWTRMGKPGSPPQFQAAAQDWADLGLKQQLLDVAERPDLTWLGHSDAATQIARYPDKTNVGGMQQFYDQTLPNKLRKILEPFGGTVERGALTNVMPIATFSRADGFMVGDKQVAALWPRWSPDTALSRGEDIRTVLNQIQARPNEVQAWIARLSPEMKQAILKKGFPIMALYGLTKLDTSFGQTQPPVPGR